MTWVLLFLLLWLAIRGIFSVSQTSHYSHYSPQKPYFHVRHSGRHSMLRSMDDDDHGR